MIHALVEKVTLLYQDSRSNSRAWSVGLLRRLFIILFFTVFFVSVYILFHPSILPIRKVKVSGQFVRLSPTELQSIVADQIRGNFFNLALDPIRHALLAEPLVHDVQIQRVWPDTIGVIVTEQAAIAYWKNTGLLSEKGVLFPQGSVSSPAGLPRLSGPDGLEKKVLDRYIEADHVIKQTDYKVELFSLNARRSWEFRLDNGVRVILGKRVFHQRLERFSDWVLAALADRFSDVEYVDLRYPNGFAVKWNRQHSLVMHRDEKNR